MITSILDSVNNQSNEIIEYDNNELTKNDVNNYGIIYTPFILSEKILNLIPEKYFKDPDMCWLDIGAGRGSFSIILYKKLNKGLQDIIPNIVDRHKHIIEKMLWMIEIYPDHIDYLKKVFGKNANIINCCFLSLNKYEYPPFDFIIGNPPYNISGSIKTPTNSKQKKTDDGRAVYVEFVKKSLELLLDGGFLNLIIPSLWLKPDKAGLYDIFTNLKIHKLHCLSTSATYKSFNYKAQTPTCYFLIEKTNIEYFQDKSIKIYDKSFDKYFEYYVEPYYPIPTHGISIINRLIPYVKRFDSLKVYKSNTPSRRSLFSDISGDEFQYINIKTCILDKNQPRLIKNYSNISQHFNDKPKLILAHKMYGFPFYDISGEYGISTRDTYIILQEDYSKKELIEIQAFLSTRFALYIFSITNYRMRYLERYAFYFLPNIKKILNFPKLNKYNRNERDKKLADFFNLSINEREIIENYSHDYKFFQ